MENRFNELITKFPFLVIALMIGIPVTLAITSYYLFYWLAFVIVVFGFSGIFIYKILYQEIRLRIHHKRKNKTNRRYQNSWDTNRKRKKLERKRKLAKMSVYERIREMLINILSYLLVLGIFVGIPIGGWYIGKDFILDTPYYFFHQFEKKTGVYQGEQIVSGRKSLSYKIVNIDDMTFQSETHMEFDFGDKVTIEYLPHTKLIMNIVERENGYKDNLFNDSNYVVQEPFTEKEKELKGSWIQENEEGLIYSLTLSSNRLGMYSDSSKIDEHNKYTGRWRFDESNSTVIIEVEQAVDIDWQLIKHPDQLEFKVLSYDDQTLVTVFQDQEIMFTLEYH
ncbi:hypothetical protein [Bacillus sp. Marseille-P3661]|uniref:hypothetical protein n=1 Tax=Bacillus sp. Marseille-P3661 TaxID=1936234 RepID=UPI000C8645F8|nr:hypothetical protein [Bacillus sp. Marseille-P3661]